MSACSFVVADCGGNLLAVVKMMAHSSHLLIRFVAFAGYKHYISGLCAPHGLTDCLAAVGDADGPAELVGVESGLHVGDNLFRFLVARVVGGQDQQV